MRTVQVIALGFLGTLLLLPTGTEAADLYVCHSGGDDKRTKAQVRAPATPWATIGRAVWGSASRNAPNSMEAAAAGDVVHVCAGTYTTAGTDLRYDPAYNPVNSGTAGAPVTIRAQGTVHLRLSSGRGPVIGVYRRDYVTWKGFSIDELHAPARGDSGPVVLWDTTGSGVEDCVLIGDPRTEVLIPDNHPGVRTVMARRVVIRNNRISGFRNQGNNAINAAGIQTYVSDGLTIEHNEISDSGSGVFLKANYGTGDPWTFVPQDSNSVRFNLIHHVGTGIAVHVNPTPANHVNLIHQNVVRDVTTGLHIRTFGRPANEPRQVKFINNTIHNTANDGFYVNAGAEFVPQAGHVLWNNIFTGATQNVILSELRGTGSFKDPSTFSSQHNVFHRFRNFAQLAGIRTLSDWQSQLGQDSAAPQSITADPRYVDAAANDFRLRDDSPARTLGRATHTVGGADGAIIPAGAYITGAEVIGLLGAREEQAVAARSSQ